MPVFLFLHRFWRAPASFDPGCKVLALFLAGLLISVNTPVAGQDRPSDQADPPRPLIMDMDECVQFGLEHNPLIKAAEHALDRAGAEVRGAFADFLPRVDTGYNLRRVRQVKSGLPPEVREVDEENGENDVQADAAGGPEVNEGMRLLQQSLAKQGGESAGPQGSAGSRSSSLTKQNEVVPVSNPLEELQQQLEQVNQALNLQTQALGQQTQAMDQVSQNLSQVNQNLSDLDESLDDLNVKLDELQETLSKRPIDPDSSSFDENVWYLRVSQPLFRGFTIANAYVRSRLTREIMGAELEHVRLEVARDIRQAFLNVLWAQEDQRSLEASVARLEGQLDAAQAFFRLGLAPRLAMLQAEVDLSEAKQNLGQVENAVRVHTARLLTLMGLPADTALEPAGRLESHRTDFALSLKECWAQARRNRPDLFIAHKAVEVAEKDVHLAWGRFAPNLNLDFAYHVQNKSYRDEQVAERYDLRNREYWTVGLVMNMNLFEGGRSQAEVARARHELFRIRKMMLHHELDAAYDVEAAFLVLSEAQVRIESSVKVRQAAQEAYDMALVRFRTEIGTHTELLDAQERLTRAETRSNQARAEYSKARAHLYFAMGWLEAK